MSFLSLLHTASWIMNKNCGLRDTQTHIIKFRIYECDDGDNKKSTNVIAFRHKDIQK